MNEENKCSVCLSEGFKDSLLEDGVCMQCRKLWPGAKTPEDRNKKKKPEVESHETIIKDLVIKQIDELLESYGLLHRCLTCGKLYYRRSPAQKNCDFCKNATKGDK